MSVIIRTLVASAFALSATTTFAAHVTTIDFTGGPDLGSTQSVEAFNNSQVTLSGNISAINLVEPGVSFTGLTFDGGGDFLSLDFGSNAVSEVTLNLVNITDLRFSAGQVAEGSIFSFANLRPEGQQFFNYTFGAEDVGDTLSLTFTADENPFSSIFFDLTSPKHAFEDPDSGEVVFIGQLLTGIDSLTYTLDQTYTPPIPEPETYALMLAGLGLLGFVSRRRLQQKDQVS